MYFFLAVPVHLIIAAMLTGYGILWFRLMGLCLKAYDEHVMPLVLQVCGIALISTIAVTLNFFVPVTGTVSAIVVACGLLALFISRNEILQSFHFKTYSLLFVTLLILNYGISLTYGLKTHDTGLYHLQAVKWIIQSPVPAGLTNLHGRLGFNSNLFAGYAITDFFVFATEKPIFILNILIASFYLTTLMLKAGELLRKSSYQSVDFANLFFVATLIPVIIQSRFYGSFSPDFPLVAMILLLIYHVILLFAQSFNFQSAQTFSFNLLLLTCFTLTIKLSSAPLATVILLLGFYWHQIRHKIDISLLSFRFKIALIGTLFFCSWILVSFVLKGYILSGYPAYPHHAFGISSPWTVPIAKVHAMSDLIKNWARAGAQWQTLTNNWAWLWQWGLKLIIYERTLVVFTTFVMLLMVLYCQHPYKTNSIKKSILTSHFFVPLGVICPGLIFWFFTAPDPRFAHGFIYGLFAFILSFIAYQTEKIIICKKMMTVLKAMLPIASISALMLATFVAFDQIAHKQVLTTFLLKRFPAIDIAKLPQVFLIFFLAILTFAAIASIATKRLLATERKGNLASFEMKKVFFGILATTVFFYMAFELPPLLSSSNRRFDFPWVSLKINSLSHATTFSPVGTDQTWNESVFTTPIPNRLLYTFMSYDRPMFIDLDRESKGWFAGD